MHSSARVFFLTALLLWGGCATPFQGIRFRAQAPPIDDAFRKISLALQADGYQINVADPASHTLSTGWRDLKAEEQTDPEKRLPPGTVRGRIAVRLEGRGMLFEVYATPTIRVRSGEEWNETVADVHHPFRTRVHSLLLRLLERESSDGD